MPDHSAAFPPDPGASANPASTPPPHFLHETLFALGNGYVGLRGSHEEGYGGPAGTSLDGSYLNGFYESEPIVYPEAAFGLAKTNQFMLNVPNAKGIALVAWAASASTCWPGRCRTTGAAWISAPACCERSLEWTSPRRAARSPIRSRRLVCFAHKHLFAHRIRSHAAQFFRPAAAALDHRRRRQQPAGGRRSARSVRPSPDRPCSWSRWNRKAIFRPSPSAPTTAALPWSARSSASSPAPPCAPSQNGQAAGQASISTPSRAQTVRLTKFGAYFSRATIRPTS